MCKRRRVTMTAISLPSLGCLGPEIKFDDLITLARRRGNSKEDKGRQETACLPHSVTNNQAISVLGHRLSNGHRLCYPLNESSKAMVGD
jgi:hypothetical protein